MSSQKWALLLLSATLVAILACTSGTPDSSTSRPSTPARGAEASSPTLAADAVLETIGFGSCLHQEDAQPILDPIQRQGFDLFLFLGDNVYGDVTSPDDLAELRGAYARQAESAKFQNLRRSTPVLAIWDDHDYGLNDAGANFAGREDAEQLFENFWQIPGDAPSAHRPGIYDAHIFGPPGRRVQILLLDTRFFRSDLKKASKPGRRYDPDPDPDKTMLGDQQWRWLEEQLRKPAELRLLVSSIQVLADGHGWEAWATLPRERERLFEMLRKTRAKGVIALSGDRHRAGIYEQNEAIGYPFYEVTSSSLNRPSQSPEEPGPNRLGPTYLAENFGAIRIDWQSGTIELEVADIGGDVVLSKALTLEQLRPADGRD